MNLPKKTIVDREGNEVLPITHISAVYDDNGISADTLLTNINELIENNRTVVTLNSAPNTSTLTYILNGATKNFVVGLFVRVADQNVPSGYTFYQLHAITNNEAKWIECPSRLMPVYTAPTAKTDLSDNGTAQVLLNAGSTNDGVIEYSSDNTNWSTTIPSQTNAGTYTVYWRLIGEDHYADIASTAIQVTIDAAALLEGVFAVMSNGDEVANADINTSNTSLYVGVGIRDTSKNIAFFIDKRFPTGSAAAASVCNYKKWSSALYNKDQSYLTNINTATGDGSSIVSAAPEATRTAAFTAYNNGETGVANTNNIVNDSNCSSETAANNAAKYCRSIANPVTGSYDGYLGSLAEWIVVNDNQVEINQILNKIGGVQFSSTNSGYSSSGNTYTNYWTSSEYSSSNAWRWIASSSLSFARFNSNPKDSANQSYCSMPFFPLS